MSAGFSKMMVVLADELWAAMAMLTTRSRRRLVFLSSFLWSDGIWSSGRPSGYSLVRRMGEAKEAAMKVAERVAWAMMLTAEETLGEARAMMAMTEEAMVEVMVVMVIWHGGLKHAEKDPSGCKKRDL
jgi:hypothetical protein